MDKKLIIAFDGGINQSIDCQYLKPNEAALSENCDLSKGNLSLCKGYSNFGHLTHTAEIKTIFNFYNATVYFFNNLRGVIIIIDVNGNTYALNQNTNVLFLIPDSWIQVQGQTYLADYVNYQSDSTFMTIYTNMHDYVKVIENIYLQNDGDWLNTGTVRRLKKDGKNSAVSDKNIAPRGRYIELYKERLWICGGDLYNIIWFSASYDPEDFTMPISENEANQHGGFIYLPTWDNGVIVGIKGLFDDVIVFKTNNIYRIYGSSPENFTVSQVADNFQGTIANNTIKSYNSGIFFTAHDGIYLYNGVTVKNISQRIEDRFIGRPVGQVSTAVAIIYNNKYIVAIKGNVPDPGNDPLWGSVNNIIIEYDMLTQNFMVKTGFEVSDFLLQNDELLFVNRENKILKYDDTYKFNTNLIQAFWKTGDLTFGEVDKKKRVQGFYFVAKGSGSIMISVVTETKIKTKIVPLTNSFIPYKIKLKNKGKVINFKFENVSGSSFTIKQVEVLYSD